MEGRTLLAASRKIPTFSPATGDQLKVPTAVQLSLCELAFRAGSRPGPCICCEGQKSGLHANGTTTSRLNPPKAPVNRPSGQTTCPIYGSDLETTLHWQRQRFKG